MPTDAQPQRRDQRVAVPVGAAAERDLEFRLGADPDASPAADGEAEPDGGEERVGPGGAGAREEGDLVRAAGTELPACVEKAAGVRCAAPVRAALVTPAQAAVDRAERARAVREADGEARRDGDGGVDGGRPGGAELVGEDAEGREAQLLDDGDVDGAGGEDGGADPFLGERGRAQAREGEDGKQQRAHGVTITAVAVAALAACADPTSELSEVYYRGPGQRVLCAVGIDERRNDVASIESGLDRARDEGVVVQLYGHVPGGTLPLATLEATLAGARARGLASFTYRDFAAGRPAEAGIALSLDDDAVEAWASVAPMFETYEVRATFFITRYHRFTAAQRARLQELAAAGHDVEAHGVEHLRAPEYAETFGLAAYVADEVAPGVAALRADGHDPVAFAYPFGARTGELDRTLLDDFAVLRSVTFQRDGLFVSDPCPE